MPDFPTRLDLFNVGRRHVLARAKRLDPEQVNVEGSDVNIIVQSSAAISYQVVLQLAQKVNSLLLDGAVNEDLDRLAWDRYQLSRKGAQAAVAEVRFFRADATAGQGSVPEGTRLQTLTGAEYVTITTATFSITGLSATATARATQAGKETQVGRNAVRRILEPTELFDPTLEVNNDEPASGGEPREEDEDFRERVRDFFNTVRRGTKGAIEFGAKLVSGIVSATAEEVIGPDARPARLVNLYIADSSGVANVALGRQADESLEEWRAAGIAVITSTSIPAIVSISLKLTFLAGVDTATLTERIRAAVVNEVNNLGVNEPLLRVSLSAVLQRFKVDGLLPLDDTIAEPAGDLIPEPGTTLRTSQDNVAVI